jgi:hypothetical protein
MTSALSAFETARMLIESATVLTLVLSVVGLWLHTASILRPARALTVTTGMRPDTEAILALIAQLSDHERAALLDDLRHAAQACATARRPLSARR